MALALVLMGLASWPVALGVLGALMNLLAGIANRGRMPVVSLRQDQTLADPRHHVEANTGHRLLILADRIPIGPSLRASPGDVLLALGAALPVLFFVF